MFEAISDWVEDQFAPSPEEQRKRDRQARGKAAFASASGRTPSDWQGMLNRTGALQAQHFGQHADMIRGTGDAIKSEMDRRVHISRELRRMQHEKDLAAMRMQSEREEREGALIRALLSGR